MKAMLFHPVGLAPAGSAFAAQAPAHLVDRDLVAAVEFRPRKLKCRGERRAAAADDGNAYPPIRRAHQLRSFAFHDAGRGRSSGRRVSWSPMACTIWLAVRPWAVLRSAPRRSAHERSAEKRSAPSMMAPRRSDPCRLVLRRMARRRVADSRLARCRSE